MHFVYSSLLLIAGYKWGDWKNWSKYYPTILFFIVCDLLNNFLNYKHSFWTFNETIFAEEILFNHTIISLMIMLTAYPATVLIYLGNLPKTRWKQLLWIAFWVILYTSVEFISLTYLNLISHYNGWTMLWSIIFNIVMFSILRLHYKHPPLAWILSAIWVITLILIFKVPIELMK